MNESYKKETEAPPAEPELETLKKEFTGEEDTPGAEGFTEVQRETVVRRKVEAVRRDREIENLKGHVKFLYGMLNNVLFTLNQHAVVINNELLPAKHKFLESKVMVKMFENIVSGAESVKLLNVLSKKDTISIFRSSGERQASMGCLNGGKAPEARGRARQAGPERPEQNVTSNADNVVGTSGRLPGAKQSKQLSQAKVFDMGAAEEEGFAGLSPGTGGGSSLTRGAFQGGPRRGLQPAAGALVRETEAADEGQRGAQNRLFQQNQDEQWG